MTDFTDYGLMPCSQLNAQMDALYDNGMTRGTSTGWPSLDQHYTVAPSQWTLVTGIPGHGKSEFLDDMMVNLMNRGWVFAVYSPENQPCEIHLAKLVEKCIGLPFRDGPNQRMTKKQMLDTVYWLNFKLSFVNPTGEQPKCIEDILYSAWAWFQVSAGKHRGIVIDPWNELAHTRPIGTSETEYISQTLSEVRRFARTRNCHVWIVAHPRTLYRDKDGKTPIPRAYDVSGSAHWFNKADNILCVWRETGEDATDEVQIHVQKVRFKHIGRPGVVYLRYDRVTGKYREQAPKVVQHWSES